MKSSVIKEFSKSELPFKKLILMPKETEVITFNLKDKNNLENTIKFAKIDFKKNINKDLKIKLNENEFQVNTVHKAINRLNGEGEFIIKCFKSEDEDKNQGHIEYPLKNVSCEKATSSGNICKWIQVNGNIEQYPFIFVKWHLGNAQFLFTKIDASKFVVGTNFLLHSFDGTYLRIIRDGENSIKQEFNNVDSKGNNYAIGISEIYQSNTNIEV